MFGLRRSYSFVEVYAYPNDARNKEYLRSLFSSFAHVAIIDARTTPMPFLTLTSDHGAQDPSTDRD